MKNLIIYLALLLCLFVTKNYAQESFESKAKTIANKIVIITQTEKNALKQEIESVNLRLDNGQITKAQADEKKLQLAQARATIIENKVAEMQMKLKDLIQQKVDEKMDSKTEVVELNATEKLNGKDLKNGKYVLNRNGKFVNINEFIDKRNYTEREIKIYEKTDSTFNTSFKKVRSFIEESRTIFQITFAVGLNNVLTNQSIANSDFKYLGSHFYEIGNNFNTRVLKNNNLFHIIYGFAFTVQNLRPTGDRVFIVNNDQTNLQYSSGSLDDSRFRNLILTFPVHFELDFTKPKQENGKTYFETHKSFRLGLGGYLGTNLGTRQHIEYEYNGYDNENIIRGDFNTSNFIYGASTYIGFKQISLYLKYDLNPLFRNNTIKQNNISLGVRFDFN